MTIPEVDGLLWLAAALALVYWLFKAGVGWLGSKGWLSDDLTHGIIGVIP